MPNLHPNQGFEPSRESLELWLGTRKQKLTHGTVTFSGLYQTYQFTKDAAAFVLVFLLELAGLFALIFAWKKLDAISIGVVTAFFVIDAVCAWFSHYKTWRIHRNESEKILNLGDPTITARLDEDTKIIKRNSNLFRLGIISVALLKIYAFTVLSYHFNGITLLVIVIYALVAFIHIYNTGFCIWEIRTRRAINNEHSKYLAGEGHKAIIYSEDMYDLILKEHSVNQHSIKKVINTSSERLHYIFSATGILTDEELRQFIVAQQNTGQRSKVALAGLEVQLRVIGIAKQIAEE
jgi:hypothetical protein